MDGNGNRILIIYHNQDLDGVVSASVARLYYSFFNDVAIRLVGYNYGEPVAKIEDAVKIHNPDTIIVTDISFGSDTESVFKSWQINGLDVVWIDHHKTAIESSERWEWPVEGLRRVGGAATALAWEWFGNKAKEEDEGWWKTWWRNTPLIIQAVSDYDVWNTGSNIGWDNILDIQYGLRSEIGLDPKRAYTAMCSRIKSNLDDIAVKGKAIRAYERQKFETQAKANAFRGLCCGYKAMFVNTLDFGSLIFETFDSDPDIQVLVCFSANVGKGTVRFGIYHHPSGGSDVDCGKIAKLFSGGGHAGAAGFEVSIFSAVWMGFTYTNDIEAPKKESDKKEVPRDNRTLAC